jgi:hypothetical protein
MTLRDSEKNFARRRLPPDPANDAREQAIIKNANFRIVTKM